MHNPKKNCFLFLPHQDISFTVIKLLNWVKYAQSKKELLSIFTSPRYLHDNIHNDKIAA